MITKTSKMVFASIIAVVLIAGTFAAVEAESIKGNKNTIAEPQDIESGEYDQTENFQEFSDTKINQYRLQIESDTEIKSLMENNDFKYSSIAYRLDPVITVFDITYENEDGTKIRITFDNDKIVNHEKYESKGKWGTANGIVNKYYDGSHTAKGIGHNFDTPSSFSSTDTNDWNALLTNAVKNGSDLINDDLCNSASSPDTYWAQSGVQFDDQGVRAGWTDTEEDCDPQFFSLVINDGDTIYSKVYLDSSVANKWWMTVDNLDDGFAPYGTSRTVTGSTSVIKDEPMTGVWWENHYTPNESWASDFGSDVVSDYATYKSTSDNSWYYWGSETQDTSICKPVANPLSVVSGAFDVGNRDVTWDVSDIEDDCGRGWH